MTYILSFIVAFGVAAIAGQILIPVLRRLKAGQSIREDGPTWHMSKQGTPTMGGLMFILAVAVAIVAAGWQELSWGNWNHIYVFLFALVFGIIGFIDDFQKLRHHANEGLTAPQKFLLQLAAAIAFTALLRYEGYLTSNLYIPFFNGTLILPWVVYMVFAAFVMVGTVNAVNLTDGIDGLATGVTIPVSLFYVAVAAWYGKTDVAVVAAALAGGLSAFLIYNFHPAKVFMGDTGSLFLGGMVCGLAFALDIPLVIPIVGLVYVVEVLSDIIQVAYFKKTHGKRFFRMAPLHHHLELGGWSETKLFCVFSGATLVLCVLAFIGVMNRYPM
ncbi:phospho-N-acetylmuramoyl-pentapeptide-transferase [Flavonifractor sp. An100]|uniref:phospho-N-acetylmuramoyl-pentapeptide- transferase n=1 Tax=Flavonifractor sp. An100 TaxID=1965538 RepID=UPI000B37A5B5|nr:phospho-N-acetylmuramoyl-pentapeptide-transferase [Flavonifractor sp. An100]OUQ81123.1 phospho-N-acetylmuramoyl-pentapeptide-transferase [Flavonifractor sp. An100]